MKQPAIRKSLRPPQRDREAGVTIVLVAAALVATMAMAALSIDMVTLYLADANAQQAADAAALAGARILSLSGMTGDPQNNSGRWAAACTSAQQVAAAVANQITVGGTLPASITVTFPNDASANCSDAPGTNTPFGVNPEVQVKVQSTSLPTFFARIWGKTGTTVSATATAEVFNSSNSDTVGNSGPTGTVIPVQPRCVKPWIVPNLDPGGNVTGTLPFVTITNGSVFSPGIRVGAAAPGIVGEQFSLFADCAIGAPCTTVPSGAQPTANVPPGPSPPNIPLAPNLEYVPGLVPDHSTAVPSCGNESPYQEAVSGCDQKTAYQCGVPSGNNADLSVNPGGPTGDTAIAVQCLTHQVTQGPTPSGQDTLNSTVFPFQFSAGSSNPLAITGQVTSSNSIVSLPIYDSSAGVTFAAGTTTAVTIVGFLQVFINYVDTKGSLNVTVLNVAGCGNGSAGNIGNPVTGSSPVPVRLITYP
jgi:hypothetical protein